MTPPKRVFIYGSCVTRDTVKFWDDYRFELAGYVARQSVVSAYSPADPRLFQTSQISSPFQRRMVEGDIRGNLLDAMSNADYDLMIWDITDERGGFYEVPEGGCVTRLAQYEGGAYKDPTPLITGPRFGKDAHYELWSTAVDRFIADLDAAGRLKSTVVNAIPWADRLDSGEPLDMGNRPAAKWFNPAASRYYDYLEAAGLLVARTPPELVAATEDHQWGLEPYHYSDATYLAALDSIASILGRADAP